MLTANTNPLRRFTVVLGWEAFSTQEELPNFSFKAAHELQTQVFAYVGGVEFVVALDELCFIRSPQSVEQFRLNIYRYLNVPVSVFKFPEDLDEMNGLFGLAELIYAPSLCAHPKAQFREKATSLPRPKFLSALEATLSRIDAFDMDAFRSFEANL